MNRRIEKTLNLTFYDYYVKRVELEFTKKPIISESNEESRKMFTSDIDFDLLFGVPDRAIDVEFNIENNQVPEESRHSDELTITGE